MTIWDQIAPEGLMLLGASEEFLRWGRWVLALPALILVYRHGILAYGAFRQNWESTALYFAWAVLSMVSTQEDFSSYICLFVLLIAVELVITSYALHRTPFMTFNVGLWLGILSLVHPAYIVIVPFMYIKLREIHIASARHTSGYLIGICCAWWLGLLLMAVPTWEGISAFLLQHVEPITELRTLPPTQWFVSGVYAVLLLFITIQSSTYIGRAVNRYRWGIVTHLWLAWIFFVLWFIYGGSVHAFFGASLFFTAASFTFLTVRGEVRLFTKLFVLLLTIGAATHTLIYH